MAYKIKNINYNSISNADEYVVYTVAFDVEDTKSKDQVGFTHDFYFANGTKQDEVTASVISLLSGAVSIMYNKATYYNLSITSDEVADVISTVLAIPELTTESTATEAPVVEESTSTPIDSFGEPTVTEEAAVIEETSTVETVVEPEVVTETVVEEPVVETTVVIEESTTVEETPVVEETTVTEETTTTEPVAEVTTEETTTTDTTVTDTTTDTGSTDTGTDTTSTDTTENNG